MFSNVTNFHRFSWKKGTQHQSSLWLASVQEWMSMQLFVVESMFLYNVQEAGILTVGLCGLMWWNTNVCG